MGDSIINGETIEEVIHQTTETLECLEQGLLAAGKTLTDSRKINEALSKESLYSLMLEPMEARSKMASSIFGIRLRIQTR